MNSGRGLLLLMLLLVALAVADHILWDGMGRIAIGKRLMSMTHSMAIWR